MKRQTSVYVLMVSLLLLLMVGAPAAGYSAGTFVGYSWQGEARGVSLDEARQKVETLLTLDADGVITDLQMRFWVQRDGFWTTRQAGAAFVDVDYSVTPTAAIPGAEYQAGDSMFTVFTADMMSFYAVGVSEDGTVAVGVVCPTTRFLLEMQFEPGFDFTTELGELTIGNGGIVPTVRTSGSGLLRPQDWSELADRNLFSIHFWNHVLNDMGVFEGISTNSSVEAFLLALDVEFVGGLPQEKAVAYGYFGLGGWHGNYEALRAHLIGINAWEKTSLVDWSAPRYAGAVNEDNVFGVDVATGATRTVQNSIDSISGATVRISREATSYQRALVAAGIIAEEDVVVGRF